MGDEPLAFVVRAPPHASDVAPSVSTQEETTVTASLGEPGICMPRRLHLRDVSGVA